MSIIPTPRRILLLAPLAAPSIARATSPLLPGIFSIGQSQTGRGGTNPPRTGPRDTDTVARFPDTLFAFRMAGGADGTIVNGLARSGPQPRPPNRFVAADALGFAAYADPPGEVVNAATPFLFALTARLRARGAIPRGLFGFTAWQGGAPLNAFLPPGDPDYLTDPAPATNYENLVAAIARYAELARGVGCTPFVPLIRFEHGEARILPYGEPPRLRDETSRYVAAHIRLTDALVADIRGITGQARDPVFLLGGWGTTDTRTEVIDTAAVAVPRLVAARPRRYVGPTCSAYQAPLYDDAGPTSPFHPGFVGRVIVGEAQARVADLCLGAGLRPNAAGYAPLACTGVTAVDATRTRFDLAYRRPPGATGPIAFVVDDFLPPTPVQGFGYLGPGPTAVAAVQVVGDATVRVTLSAPAAAGARIGYAYGPLAPAEPDQRWNNRGNLVCPHDGESFYRPILAAAPYELALPPSRDVAIQQAVTLP